MSYTATTKYAQMVELYWHVQSFVVDCIAQSLDYHQLQNCQQQQPTSNDIWTQIQLLTNHLSNLQRKIHIWHRHNLGLQQTL